MPTFTPPTRTFLPRVNADTPDWQMKPAIYFKADIPVGVNVWLDTANLISENQPPLWVARTNPDGSITPGVKKVWYGGHSHPITADEAVMLTAAGYGANIV